MLLFKKHVIQFYYINLTHITHNLIRNFLQQPIYIQKKRNLSYQETADEWFKVFTKVTDMLIQFFHVF